MCFTENIYIPLLLSGVRWEAGPAGEIQVGEGPSAEGAAEARQLRLSRVRPEQTQSAPGRKFIY